MPTIDLRQIQLVNSSYESKKFFYSHLKSKFLADLPESCEDLYFIFGVTQDGYQYIFNNNIQTKVYCQNSIMVDGVQTMLVNRSRL